LGKVIVDTGALYALVDKSDKWHIKVKDFIEKHNPTLIIPCSILPEVCYLINKYLGQEAEINFLVSHLNKRLSLKTILGREHNAMAERSGMHQKGPEFDSQCYSTNECCISRICLQRYFGNTDG